MDPEDCLFDAIEHHDSSAAQEFILTSCDDSCWKNGTFANVNCYDNEGATPLMRASHHGLLEIITKLLAAGATVNALHTIDMQSPLMLACKNGHTSIADILIKAGAHIDHADNYGDTAFLLACRNGHVATAQLLVNAGANTAQQATYGDSALIMASQEGQIDTVCMLIGIGADVNLPNTSGNSALWCACKKGHSAVVQALINGRANINHTDSNGKTPLMFASAPGHTVVVDILIHAGADINLCDKTGCTALLLASNNCHITIIRSLMLAGADPTVCGTPELSPLTEALYSRMWCEPYPPLIPLYNADDTTREMIIREFLVRGAQPDDQHTKLLTSAQLALIEERYETIKRWLLHLEDIYTIPRDLSRLIGTCAGLSSTQNLPPPLCTAKKQYYCNNPSWAKASLST